MTYRWQKLSAIVTIIAILMILSSSLSALEFRGGQERTSFWFISEETGEVEEVVEGVDSGGGFNLNVPIQGGVLFFLSVILWVLIPTAILYSIFTRDGRRSLPKAFATALIFGLGFFGIYIFVTQFGAFLSGNQGNPVDGTLLDRSTIPSVIIVSTSAVVAVIISLALWSIYKQGQQLMRPRQAVLQSAKRAIDEIDAGEALRSVIMRCYADMLAAAQQVNGTKRNAHVTPLEFAQSLQSVGLPAQEVTTLTRLFEKVRYGGEAGNSAERQTARACLTAIIATCEQLTS